MSKELIDRLTEQNDSIRKMTLEKLESEHKYVLEQMIESRDNYDELFGYYFGLVSELYSRCVLEEVKNGTSSSFNRLAEYRYSLQKRIEDSTAT